MNFGKDSGPLIPISGIVALLAFIGFSFYSQTPLTSTRPHSAEIQFEPYEKVTARLWQDPFSAVLEHLKKNKINANVETIYLCASSVNKYDRKINYFMARQIKEKEKQKEKVTVLGVMIPGTEYTEDGEARIRQRYAVLAGLRNQHFLPKDSEHIQYAFLKINNEPNSSTNLINILPYEWFSKVGEKEHVLVLWLNEKTFQDYPLRYFSRLFISLDKFNERKIIGPWESLTLKNMLLELKSEETIKKSELNKLAELELYSAFATADTESILGAGKNDDDIKYIFQSRKINFDRIIGSDTELAQIIINELNNRQVNLKDKDKRIILVSESDTLYADALCNVFHRELSKLPKKNFLFKETQEEKADIKIYDVKYLRGIDGILPGEMGEKTDKKGADSNQNNKPDFDLSKLEKPTGKSQYDYLRRYADKLYYHLKRRHRAVAAIGILGNDFHDKNLVLQAFHQRFPHAIYFTTDLDAMWMHPANLQWTRNLLVASHFDISAQPEDNEIIPSFRDSYQMSTFMALKETLKSKPSSQKREPLLFEIGNTRAVNLSGPIKNKNISLIYYPVILISSVIILGVLAVFFFANEHIVETLNKYVIQDRRNLLIAVLIVCVFLLILFNFNTYILEDVTEEPFSFFDGISVWPANHFRLLALILSVFFIFFSYISLENNEKKIQQEFFDENPLSKDPVNEFTNNIRTKKSYTFFKEHTKAGKQIFNLWHEYTIRNNWPYRIWWVFIALICLVLICFITSLFPFFCVLPEPPVRGTYSYWITQVIFYFSIISFSSLFLYVFDATRLCHRFIMNITNKKYEWPKKSLEKYLDNNEQQLHEEQEKFLSEWLTVNLVAQRTKAVGRLIFYPLIIWIIMYFACHSYFDNWRTTIPLAVILTSGVIITWVCALMLRFDAEHLRKKSILRLKEQKILLLLRKDAQDIKNQIDKTIEDIQSIREGAFVPFSQHPVFQSIMLALSSVGGTYLLEFANIFKF
ncbi:MAG: hypothetical protein ABFD50_16785 [Smithella sp.]